MKNQYTEHMQVQQYGSMSSLVASKHDLLEHLRENRNKHNVIYEAAVSGYYKEVAKELDEKVDSATKLIAEYEKKKRQVAEHNKFNQTFKTYLAPTTFKAKFPENHLYDYDKAIKMLELSALVNFSLTNQEFDQYVMNNWAWKSTFLGTNLNYVSGYYGSGVMNLGTGCYNGIQLSGIANSF